MADYTDCTSKPRDLGGRNPSEALRLDVRTTASMRAPGGRTGQDVRKVSRKLRQCSVLVGMKMFTLIKTLKAVAALHHLSFQQSFPGTAPNALRCVDCIATTTTTTPPINLPNHSDIRALSSNTIRFNFFAPWIRGFHMPCIFWHSSC